MFVFIALGLNPHLMIYICIYLNQISKPMQIRLPKLFTLINAVFGAHHRFVYRMLKGHFTQGCGLRGTFERPVNWSGSSVVAQTDKVLFLCNCCSTTLVRSLNHRQEVVQRRRIGGRTIATVAEGLPWSSNGDTVVATVIAEWTLLVGQRRHSGGTREAEASLKLTHNVYNNTHFLRGDQWPTPVHPCCDHGDVCAFLLPLLCGLWGTDREGNLCATVLNMLKTLRSTWPP